VESVVGLRFDESAECIVAKFIADDAKLMR